jgi:hypothetical protein
MRLAIAFAVLGLWGFGDNTVKFDNVKPGALPPSWSAASTHAGVPPRWEVRPDHSAPSSPNVLEQVARGTGEYEFPLAIFDKVICRDGEVSVKFKIDGGHHARTAGIVWRYQDPDNYYLLHFSADEKNIVLFRVRNGKAEAVPVDGRKSGSFGVAHDIRVGQWYVARVIFRGSQFRVLFGNRRLFEAEDGAIPEAGKTGLWTKGRTAAEFDDFRVDKKG